MTARPKWDYCMKELFRNLWRRYKYQKQGIVDETMTKNPGILEAVKEVRHISLGRWARAMYDGHMKMVRDQHARDAYVRDSGAEQERARLSTLIAHMDAAGEGDQVARLQDPEFVQEMLKKYDL